MFITFDKTPTGHALASSFSQRKTWLRKQNFTIFQTESFFFLCGIRNGFFSNLPCENVKDLPEENKEMCCGYLVPGGSLSFYFLSLSTQSSQQLASHHQVLLCLPASSEERLALALLNSGASALGDSESALFVVSVCGFCFVFSSLFLQFVRQRLSNDLSFRPLK